MTVYLVIEDYGYDGITIKDACATHERAVELVHKLVAKHNENNTFNPYFINPRDDYGFINKSGASIYIEEWDVKE